MTFSIEDGAAKKSQLSVYVSKTGGTLNRQSQDQEVNGQRSDEEPSPMEVETLDDPRKQQKVNAPSELSLTCEEMMDCTSIPSSEGTEVMVDPSQHSAKGKEVAADQGQQHDLNSLKWPSRRSFKTSPGQPSSKGKEVQRSLTFKIGSGQAVSKGKEVMVDSSQVQELRLQSYFSQPSSNESQWPEVNSSGWRTLPVPEDMEAINDLFQQSVPLPHYSPSRTQSKGKETMVDQGQTSFKEKEIAVVDPRQQQDLHFHYSSKEKEIKNGANQLQDVESREQAALVDLDLRANFDFQIWRSQQSRKGKKVMDDQSQKQAEFHVPRQPSQPSSSGKDIIDDFSQQLELRVQNWVDNCWSADDPSQAMDHQLQILLSEFWSKRMNQMDVSGQLDLFSQLSAKGKELLDYVREQKENCMKSSAGERPSEVKEVTVDRSPSQGTSGRRLTLLDDNHIQKLGVWLSSFWKMQTYEVSRAIDFRFSEQPLTAIKKIMTTYDKIRVPLDTLLVFARACRMFVGELTVRSWFHALQEGRNELLRSDVADAVASTELFDFLVNVMRREDDEGFSLPPVEQFEPPPPVAAPLPYVPKPKGRRKEALPVSRFAPSRRPPVPGVSEPAEESTEPVAPSPSTPVYP